MNLYRYVQNNPVNYTDPLGLILLSQKSREDFGKDFPPWFPDNLIDFFYDYYSDPAAGIGPSATGLTKIGTKFGKDWACKYGKDVSPRLKRFFNQKLGQQVDEYRRFLRRYKEHLEKYGQTPGKTSGEVNRIERQLEGYREILTGRGKIFSPGGELLE